MSCSASCPTCEHRLQNVEFAIALWTSLRPLDTAGVAAGMRVLDLACGAGSQPLQAARRVGPKGRVVAVDIAASMLTHVKEAAARKALTNIQTLGCAAEDLPQTPAAFDAAISRLGLMLFPDPKQALTAVRRVLKPNAGIAMLVFTTPSANPFTSQPIASGCACASASKVISVGSGGSGAALERPHT